MRARSLAVLLLLVAGCGDSQSSSPPAAGATPSGGAAGAGGSSGGAGGAAAGSGGAAGTAGTGGAAGGFATPDDIATYLMPPRSCAFHCPSSKCAESTKPYACPAMGDWASLPHLEACGTWDGTYPTPQQGQCTVTMPTGEAAKYGGVDPDDATTQILPDGRRLKPAGTTTVFPDKLGATSAVITIPGTSFVVSLDTGDADHIVRAIDPSKIGNGDPVVSKIDFPESSTLNQSLVFSAPNRIFVATWDGIVQALTIDTTTGMLARDDMHDVMLPTDSYDATGKTVGYYAAAVSVSADGKYLFVAGVYDKRFLVYDVGVGSANYGAKVGEVQLPAGAAFGVYVDPADASTQFAYVTGWGSKAVYEVDLTDKTMPKAARTFMVGKSPEGAAFPDARWMIVGNALGDTYSIVDRMSGTVTNVPVGAASDLHGPEPTSLAYDPSAKRFYATLSGVNALAAYDVDLTSDPPKINPAGRLPTLWWPSGVAVAQNGDLLVTSLRTGPTGASPPGTDSDTLVHGGIEHVPAPTAMDLTAGDSVVTKQNDVAHLDGAPQLSCPSGVMDFPIPATNTEGPSKLIEHVIFVVRENKKFEALLGDLPGANANPANLLAGAHDTEIIWKNLRELAREFATSDNFYTDAYLSEQGHVWTTFGRTNDFTEREWPVTTYSRSTRPISESGGIPDLSRPEEGSLFDRLQDAKVPVDVLGEAVGEPKVDPAHPAVDTYYPGGTVQNIGWPDVDKACYVAARARLACDLGKVTYMTLPNDHTQGVGDNTPSPDTMIAVNDEATGMLVDAISHSSIWPKTLIVITEDDPAGGDESVDYHRTVFVFASPWIRRKYVSHTHADVSSVHKLIMNVLGMPYPNQEVANAALPLDLFTSTPDYTPYTYTPRQWQLNCGMDAPHAEKRLTASWDFDEVDEQPGLDAQVERWMKKKMWTELPPDVEREVSRRERALAR